MITPGKWSYTDALGEIYATDEHGEAKQIAIVTDNDADGVLMAQAPALLEVAELIVAHVGTNCDIPEGILRAAAIAAARARGRMT